MVHVRSVTDTIALGRRIGKTLDRGRVVGLVGALGVGKTHLAKGIAAANRARGGHPVEVTSPTFVLVNEYSGRVPLYHVDAYRLRSAGELDELGLAEMIAEGAVVVEWADRVAAALPDDRLTVTGRCTGALQREWTLTAGGSISAQWLAGIR